MSIAITEDHRALADSARAVLARQGGLSAARQSLEEGEGKVPSGWEELAGMGWPGLAVPMTLGGEGYGVAELAVIAYEAGRVAAPGPLLPTTWAAVALAAAGDDAAARWVPALARGERLGAVGEGGLVLGAPWADVLLLIDGEDVAVYEVGDGVAVHPDPSLDPTRPLARVEVTGRAAARLPGAAAVTRAVGRVLGGAEAAGVASACLDAALAYAKERVQFGRIIGSFQAVKHHLADMLVATELATAAAWDGARAVDALLGAGDAAGTQLGLAASTAASYGLGAAVEVAKKNIQVHGGIGFTWEHDAHLLLRRATALRALLGGAPDPAVELTQLARGGARREVAVDLPPEAESIRREVEVFRDELLAAPEGERRAALAGSGYLVPHWPAPWGRAAGPVEQLVIDDVLADVGRPELGIGGWVTLTIAQHGTPEQLERWIQPSLRGEIMFCQMFSEPEAGSDAAAIKTRGVPVEGGWVVNGQKVWTSQAHLADLGFATVRTDPEAPKHAGVTMMVIDLKAPGVEIRPLRQITGDSHFNEIFLTDVFVPDDDVVGRPGEGWSVARATLGNERVSIGGGRPFATPAADLAASSDPAYDAELGALIAESGAARALQQRMVARAVAGAGPGAEGNVTKLVSGELAQRTADLALRMVGSGAVAMPDRDQPVHDYLNTLCLTIAGGTSEIVRNQIAERLLGLPREPNLR
jgi:alkylation response protein AidB-like acyl-CoA dehydrogenase